MYHFSFDKLVMNFICQSHYLLGLLHGKVLYISHLTKPTCWQNGNWFVAVNEEYPWR